MGEQRLAICFGGELVSNEVIRQPEHPIRHRDGGSISGLVGNGFVSPSQHDRFAEIPDSNMEIVKTTQQPHLKIGIAERFGDFQCSGQREASFVAVSLRKH